MKKSTASFTGIPLIVIALFVASCSSAPKGDEAKTGDTQTVAATTGSELVIDNMASTISFTGNGVGKNHPGTFKISEGKVFVTDGKVTGGSFVIDMKSIDLAQKDEMIQTKLKGHLQSPDFLDVEKYPTSKFEITGVEAYTGKEGDSSVVAGANYTVSGNLTLKDSTKNISFPANLTMADNKLSAKANFNIDRTQWGIVYGNDKSLKDKFISETVNIKVDISSK